MDSEVDLSVYEGRCRHPIWVNYLFKAARDALPRDDQAGYDQWQVRYYPHYKARRKRLPYLAHDAFQSALSLSYRELT